VIDDARLDPKPPYWVRLVREGGAISGGQSTDGRHWNLLGSSETDLPDPVLAGQRRHELNRKIAAALLRDAAPRPALIEVATIDESLWRPARLAFGQDTFVPTTLLPGERRLPADEPLEIRRTNP
jgi:hypothetical protein